MADGQSSAFRFEGRWQDYAPIAFTNLLLTILTLGVYRFWASTRSRRYLWGHTQFIDEPLEWAGTPIELLIGFALAALLFGLPFLFLQFGVQALALQGHPGMAGLLGFAAFLFLVYLAGVARFRTLRYRLSRTFWHGIRGGSDAQGLAYGLSWFWKSAAAVVTAYLLVPWSMMSLWNERWRQMSFGSHHFRSEGRATPIYPLFLLFYLAPVLFVIAVVAVGFAVVGAFFNFDLKQSSGAIAAIVIVAIILAVAGIYIVLGLFALVFYAAFLREAIGHLSLGDVDFQFDATTKDWLKLIFGDIGLVLVTLGIGMIFLEYRHWKFFITHLEATGEVSLSSLGQSTTRTPSQGEGLFDAFDIGAI
ncbi:YjgN family protein [soil metagenome]